MARPPNPEIRELGEAYTPEEREQLIHVIKKDSLKF